MMTKNKVALFSTNFLEFSQAFVYEELINHEKYDVSVFSKTRKNEARFPYEKVYSHFPAVGLGDKIRALIYSITTYSKEFYKILKNGGFSVIHAQFGPGSIYALYYAKKLNIPLIVTFGGYDVPLLQTSRRFHPVYLRYWLFSKKMLRQVDLFLPVSKDLADKLIDLGAPAEKVKVFHRGIVIPENIEKKILNDKGMIKILMVGRFVEKKGFEYGIQAVAKAVKEKKEVCLTIIGDGPLKKKYENLISDNSLAGSVEILNNMPQKEIFNRMFSSDIIMVPSVVAHNGDTEGITNVLKEGCARGLPAIITDHGGNIEIVEDGKTGFIVPERNIEALYEKIVLFADNRHLIVEMGNNAAIKIKNELDIKHTNYILEQHYDEVTKKYKEINNKRGKK